TDMFGSALTSSTCNMGCDGCRRAYSFTTPVPGSTWSFRDRIRDGDGGYICHYERPGRASYSELGYTWFWCGQCSGTGTVDSVIYQDTVSPPGSDCNPPSL